MDIWNAISSNNIEAVKRYVECGGPIEVRNSEGETPLIFASHIIDSNDVRNFVFTVGREEGRGCTDMVRYFVECKADVSASDRSGQTALMYASLWGNIAVVRCLIERYEHEHINDGSVSRYIDMRNNEGETALSFASDAIDGNEDIVRYLLERGAKIHIRNKDGWTPLMHASYSGNLNIVRQFIEWDQAHRSDPFDENAIEYVLNNKKQTAFGVAFDPLCSGKPEIAEYLAPLSIPKISYNGVCLSLFFPRPRNFSPQNHASLIKSIIPFYIQRAMEDSVFGQAMEHDISQILVAKSGWNRRPLTKKTVVFLTKLQKFLRSINYTEMEHLKSGDKILMNEIALRDLTI